MDGRGWKKNRLFRFFLLMVRRYLRHGVGVQSAALAFYLLFVLLAWLFVLLVYYTVKMM